MERNLLNGVKVVLFSGPLDLQTSSLPSDFCQQRAGIAFQLPKKNWIGFCRALPAGSTP
jgi:hypothetical protein